LQGSGSLDEAYASYNLAWARFSVGRCDGVLDLLNRSEQIQGQRDEIDRLRAQAESRCTSQADEGNGTGNTRGHGKKNGKQG
jgi:transcription initiation factor IIE alpha subunit